MSVEIRFSVMSPVASSQPAVSGTPPVMPAPPGPMAKRLGALDNRTLYLVDTGFGGSYQFMKQLQQWFAARMPSVTTVRKRKPGHVFMDDNNELWEEIKAKGQGVVLGVAG